MREKRNGTRKRGKEYLPPRDKGLLLDGEETDTAHMQMAIYKGTRGKTVLG